jgi:hypothetical protein
MAQWKKVIVQGGNISDLNNDANYVSVNAIPAFTTASFGGTETYASGSATTQNFSIVSGSVNTDPTVGSGLLISASVAERKATFTLHQIPTASLAHTGSYIGKTKVGLGEVVTSISGANFVDITATGSFTGSFKGDGSQLTGVSADRLAIGTVTASVADGLLNGAGGNQTIFNVKSGDNNALVVTENSNIRLGGGSGSSFAPNGNAQLVSGSVIMGRGETVFDSGNDIDPNAPRGNYSFIGGNDGGFFANTINGDHAFVWGSENTVDQYASSGSVVLGRGLMTSGTGSIDKQLIPQVFLGQYNIARSSSGDLVTIGNGTNAATRSNLAIFNTASITFNAPVTGSSFTGSFVGDGSGLTGVASTLKLSGSNAEYGFLTGSIDLKTQTLQITGSGKEIEVTLVTGSNNTYFQVGLPSNVAISQSLEIGRNLTVDGDFIVKGTASFISTQDLFVADRFIVLASGSTGANDSGIIIDRGAYVSGSVGYGYDADLNRWGYAANMTDTSNALDISTNDGNSAFAAYLFTETEHGPANGLLLGEFAQPGAFYVSGSEGSLYILV